ncbi:Uncharacterised protein [Klebsiella pneumoniae]|nr:Uncharacterised protein [Klebsiella pneumoniae]
MPCYSLKHLIINMVNVFSLKNLYYEKCLPYCYKGRRKLPRA